MFEIDYQRLKEVNLNDVDTVLGDILNKSEAEQRAYFDRLTVAQKRGLKALSSPSGAFSKETLHELNTTKSSISKALQTLIEHEIVDKEEGNYFICNRKFELWCLEKFNS